MLMCTRPLVVFWWLRKNYWSYRKNNYIFGILTKFYLRKVTSYFTCRAIRGLIFSKLPPIDWSVLRSTIWNGRRYYALRCSVTCQGFSYSLMIYCMDESIQSIWVHFGEMDSFFSTDFFSYIEARSIWPLCIFWILGIRLFSHQYHLAEKYIQKNSQVMKIKL